MRELEDGVADALAGHEDGYDVAAIADELRRLGATTVDDIGHDRFWQIVERHTVEPPRDPRETFREEMTQALSAERPAGVPAVWQRHGVRVTVTGASRVDFSWPQVAALVEVATLGGETVTEDGAGIASWDALWDLVEAALHTWSVTVAGRRAALDAARHRVETLRTTLAAAEATLRTASADLTAVLPEHADTITQDAVGGA